MNFEPCRFLDKDPLNEVINQILKKGINGVLVTCINHFSPGQQVYQQLDLLLKYNINNKKISKGCLVESKLCSCLISVFLPIDFVWGKNLKS